MIRPLLLLVVLMIAGAGTASAAPKPPSVLLITLDTTRADHLGHYGYARDTSPELDRFAADATVFEHAYSTSSWTLPAHASLFTGLYPTSHGARYDPEGPLVLSDGVDGTAALQKFRATPLSDGPRVLAEILKDAGYATGGVVAGPWLKSIFGLSRGFDVWDDSGIDDVHGKLGVDVTDQAIRFVDAQSGPFFLFLNYYDPHGPYSDPEGYARQFLPPNTVVFPPPKQKSREFLNGVYDGEIRYVDEQVGRLFAHLKEKGLYDDMWIVVTADHGELLGEHGKRGHGSSLYEEEIRIPLVVKWPKPAGRVGRSAEPVQLTDVLPLLLTSIGLAVPAGTQGGVPPAVDRPAFAEVYPLLGADPLLDWRVLVDPPYKIVWTSDGAVRLFDLGAEATETESLEDPARRQRMRERLEAFASELPPARERTGSAPVQTIDEETRRALEGLGYLE